MLRKQSGGHTHSNKNVLDQLSEEGTQLLFNGESINGHTHSNQSVLDKLSENGTELLYNGSPITGGSGGTEFYPYNKWDRKSLICHGDSITQGSSQNNYPLFIGQKLRMNVVNKGSSGADHNRFMAIACGVTSATGTTYEEPNYFQTDAVTLTIGHNGGVGTSTIADINGITDFNLYPNTYYGNFCRVIEHILWRKSSIKIYLLTPIQSLNAGYIGTTAASTTAIYEIGKKYALPVINLQHTSGLHFRNLALHTDDGTHPNATGNQMIAEVVARGMLAY